MIVMHHHAKGVHTCQVGKVCISLRGGEVAPSSTLRSMTVDILDIESRLWSAAIGVANAA